MLPGAPRGQGGRVATAPARSARPTSPASTRTDSGPRWSTRRERRRRSDGTVDRRSSVDDVREPEARACCASLPDELRDALRAAGPTSDPARGRLFPRAVPRPDRGGRRAGVAATSCTRSSLRERLDALDRVAGDASTRVERRTGAAVIVVALDPDDGGGAGSAVLNDARLALGTRLGRHRGHRLRRPRPRRSAGAGAGGLRLAHAPRGRARRDAARRPPELAFRRLSPVEHTIPSDPATTGVEHVGYLDGKTIAVTGAGPRHRPRGRARVRRRRARTSSSTTSA